MKSRQCMNCIHRIDSIQDTRPVCLAFPDGIPEVILTGDFDHTKPYAGDHGFRYQPEDKTDNDSGERDA